MLVGDVFYILQKVTWWQNVSSVEFVFIIKKIILIKKNEISTFLLTVISASEVFL